MQVQAGIMAKTQETFVIQVFQSDADPASFAKVQVGMQEARARGGTSAPGPAGASAIHTIQYYFSTDDTSVREGEKLETRKRPELMKKFEYS